MSTSPFWASVMPVPDPVPAVWILTFWYFSVYPPTHRLNSG